MATITRVFEFDTAHRVMNEKVKCYNLHGHRFRAEVSFHYKEQTELGYAIDFKELKRICGDFIDTFLDHAAMLNPMDKDLIRLCEKNGWRLWLMGFGNEGDFNPSAENIAAELFMIFKTFFNLKDHGITIVNIRLFETPNCWVDFSEPTEAPYQFTEGVKEFLTTWRNEKGDFNYDIRK